MPQDLWLLLTPCDRLALQRWDPQAANISPNELCLWASRHPDFRREENSWKNRHCWLSLELVSLCYSLGDCLDLGGCVRRVLDLFYGPEKPIFWQAAITLGLWDRWSWNRRWWGEEAVACRLLPLCPQPCHNYFAALWSDSLLLSDGNSGPLVRGFLPAAPTQECFIAMPLTF